MDGINLIFLEEKKKLPVGASKFLGNPDVWDGFEWPQFVENGEDYDLTFLCQINCAEAAPFNKENILPKSGMLYFFYDMDEMPQVPLNENAARVLYYDGDPAELRAMLRTDHEGNDMSLPEMGIRFGDDSRLPNAVLGEPLLLLYSFENDKVSIRFPGDGILCFEEMG